MARKTENPAPAKKQGKSIPKRRLRREIKLAGASGIMRGLVAGLGPDSLCVDCGAHYGIVTSQLAATGASVHAFEPDPHSWEELQRNCGKMKNVTLHNAAVAAEKGSLTLYRNARFEGDPDRGSTGSTVLAENRTALADTAITVEAIDLPAFLSGLIKTHGRINFLKMDIEGAEVDLLEKLLETDLLTRINLTVVETHRWLFPQWADRYARLYDAAKTRPECNLYLHWI